MLAVDDVSFEAGAGEVVGFLGPNGAGKTTTMRILTGFHPATDGTARIAGHDIYEDSLEARRALGYLPESPPLYPEMDVRGYLTYVSKLKDVPRRARREAVERAMERCGLADAQRRPIGALSKGFRQRVGLAQAIVHEPSVLILDEPTIGLDPNQILEIRELLARLAEAEPGESGRAIVLSTHILAEVEALCGRVILIREGRKVLDQPLVDIQREQGSLGEAFARLTLPAEAPPDEDTASAERSEVAE